DRGISNVNYQAQRSDIQFPLHVLVPDPNTGTPTGVDITTSLRNLNLTYANAWFGREWYRGAPVNNCDMTWRIGFDLGGGLGSGRAEFGDVHQAGNAAVGGIRPRSEGCAFTGAALHTDIEMPHGCWTFLAGFRREWQDYVSN